MYLRYHLTVGRVVREIGISRSFIALTVENRVMITVGVLSFTGIRIGGWKSMVELARVLHLLAPHLLHLRLIVAKPPLLELLVPMLWAVALVRPHHPLSRRLTTMPMSL